MNMSENGKDGAARNVAVALIIGRKPRLINKAIEEENQIDE